MKLLKSFVFFMGLVLNANASNNCDIFAEQALDLVMDGSHQSWEIYHASQVCSAFGVEAIRHLRKSQGPFGSGYLESEIKWASRVSNQYALEVFRLLADGSPQVWELKWATYVDSALKVRLITKLRKKGRYYEQDLQAIAEL